MKRILIIQTAFLGDVILATPIISELKRIFPSSEVDFLLKKGNESLLSNNPKLNEVIIFNKSKGKWKAIYQLIKRFRAHKYDLVVNLHRYGSSGLIAGFSKGRIKHGFKKNPFSFLYTKSFEHQIGNGTHEVRRNLSLIEDFGARKDVKPELFPSPDDKSVVEKYIKGTYYCIAPASIWFTKQLPFSKWIELIKRIPNDCSIYLLGGSEDIELCEEIRRKCNEERIKSLAGKLSLLQSAELMRNSKRTYLNDSGPLHLASSVDANVTAFFCSTIPEFGFGPLSNDAQVSQVFQLDCRPCGIHGHVKCPKNNFRCGDQINIKEAKF